MDTIHAFHRQVQFFAESLLDDDETCKTDCCRDWLRLCRVLCEHELRFLEKDGGQIEREWTQKPPMIIS